jgi:hypothetical protein
MSRLAGCAIAEAGFERTFAILAARRLRLAAWGARRVTCLAAGAAARARALCLAPDGRGIQPRDDRGRRAVDRVGGRRRERVGALRFPRRELEGRVRVSADYLGDAPLGIIHSIARLPISVNAPPLSPAVQPVRRSDVGVEIEPIAVCEPQVPLLDRLEARTATLEGHDRGQSHGERQVPRTGNTNERLLALRFQRKQPECQPRRSRNEAAHSGWVHFSANSRAMLPDNHRRSWLWTCAFRGPPRRSSFSPSRCAFDCSFRARRPMRGSSAALRRIGSLAGGGRSSAPGRHGGVRRSCLLASSRSGSALPGRELTRPPYFRNTPRRTHHDQQTSGIQASSSTR